MKTRVQNFMPEGIYCLTGNASANSLFFEDGKDQQLFLKLLDRFMRDMIVVHAYSTTPSSWHLFFTINDEESIMESFLELKKQSKKQHDAKRISKPEKMLAEHFRYFLSAYVKQSNFRHQRHGSRVHSKMEKYVFASLEDMESVMRKMQSMRETKVQKPRYRPNMAHYLVEKQLKRDSVWRHSFVGLDGEKLVQAVLPSFRWILDQTDVLRQLIQHTWNHHFGPILPPFPPPKLE